MARAAWFFPVPDEADLPDGCRGCSRKAREAVGFVPNVFRSYSYRPERFSAWFAHYKQLHEPTEHLDEADREMIAVVVSAYNRCTYCIVSHGHALRKALGDEVLADYIATNWRHAGLDERRTRDLRVRREAHRPSARDDRGRPAPTARRRAVATTRCGTSPRSRRCTTSPTGWRWPLGQQPNEEYHSLDRG